MIPPTNKDRFEALRKLSPPEAVKEWLKGAFGIGDEPALCEAIRKDPDISLSDEVISDVVIEAMDEGWTAEKCLAELRKR